MKIIFGDNQFLGVSHSQGKTNTYMERYSTPQKIANTLEDAFDAGCNDFAFSITKKTVDALKIVDPSASVNLHPCLPYAHEIYNKIADDGIFKTAISYIFSNGFINGLWALFDIIFLKNYVKISKIVIQKEIENINKDKIESIGLLNIATDFLVASRRTDILKDFYDSVRELDYEVVFYTLNPEKLYQAIVHENMFDSKMVINYNEKGFKVFPNIESVVSLTKKSKVDIYGMSVFNGKKNDPYSFVCNSDLKGIIFGSSKKENIIKNIKGFKL